MSDIQIQTIDEAEIDTILAEDIDFTGKLGFDKSLMIKGRMKGDVKAEGDFYIGESAVVEARVEANIVSVKGTVHGNIYAYDRVEIFSCGHVDGDITAPDIIMESGCSFNGICTMKSPNEVQENEE
ncbi:MAG: polymer-forming cytoskeletal protein [Spirochaetales bacterium]|uniref:Polymer-forming cytoskeletal protein n=1 Tax=Candidatus Thalassospirochaeta sargassi TaxID=3119039 RepID=A0AAJ1IA87_9SPIO|nr:polymer-forming cytoskeletal protein [Spirochaetales bacterium]